MKVSKWIKFIVLYIGAIILSISQMKVSSTELRESFISMLHLTPVEVSIYVSVFAFAPVFLAIPGGTLVKRFGAKKISILIMIALFAGNLIGYLTNSYPVMLFARVIEGVSFSFIMVASMVLLNQWFKDKGHGLAVGLFVTFSALGYAAVIYVLPLVFSAVGLKNIWLILAVLSAIVAVLYFLLFDDPIIETDTPSKKVNIKAMFKERKVIQLAIAMAILSFVLFTYLDNYPTIFKSLYNLSPEVSSFNSIAFGLIGIPAGIFVGYLIDKTKKPITIGFYSFLVMAVACFMTDKLTDVLLLIQVVALTTCVSFISTSIVSAVPQVVSNSNKIEDGYTVVYLFYYIGALVGIPAVSTTVAYCGWGVGIAFLALLALVGAMLLYSFYKTEKQGKQVPLK